MENIVVRVIVIGDTSDGPDAYACKVSCTLKQYENGEHYVAAKDASHVEGDKVAIDEYDLLKKFFPLFDWDKAPVVTLEKPER